MGEAQHLDDAAGDAAERSSLAYWAEVVHREPEFETAKLAEMTRHPRFAEASRFYIGNILSFTASDAEMMRMFIDVERLMLGFFILYLDTRGGITHASIKAFCKDIGLTSPGRATAMLVSLRMMGYIVPAPVQLDRRSRRYVPGLKHRLNSERSLRDGLLATAIITPAARAVAERIGDPAIFRTVVLCLGEGLAGAIKRDAKNAVSLFDRRNAGLGVLYRLAKSSRPGDVFPPRDPVPLSISALSNEFHVSRPHVRKLLTDAEKEGYLRRNADSSTVTLDEPLRVALAEYIAAHFIAFARCADAALRADGEAA
jgi:DNA-binding MarR family transcriptional regulator